MTRVKRGLIAHKRHHNLLSRTKGYRHGRKKIFRLAKQAWLKAGQHAYRHRREKKRTFRALWIIRLNAAVRQYHVSYSRFIDALKQSDLALDRKVLAQLAVEEPEEFKAIVDRVCPPKLDDQA